MHISVQQGNGNVAKEKIVFNQSAILVRPYSHVVRGTWVWSCSKTFSKVKCSRAAFTQRQKEQLFGISSVVVICDERILLLECNKYANKPECISNKNRVDQM